MSLNQVTFAEMMFTDISIVLFSKLIRSKRVQVRIRKTFNHRQKTDI